MENSFFEYRDKTGDNSGSDTDIIDDSLQDDQSFSPKKKHHTVVAESEEYSTDDESIDDDDEQQRYSGSISKASYNADKHKDSSSSSSSDDQQISPEIVPRRPPITPKLSEDIKTRINKKRILMESDLDNSIVIERNRNRKIVCRQETPLKIDKDDKVSKNNLAEMSLNKTDIDADIIDCDDSEDNDESFSSLKNENKVSTLLDESQNDKKLKVSESEESSGDEQTDSDDESFSHIGNRKKVISKLLDDSQNDQKSNILESSNDEKESPIKSRSRKARNILIDSLDETTLKRTKNYVHKLIISDDSDDDDDNENKSKDDTNDTNHDVDDKCSSDDDAVDEDQMVMSRATRMSIMGVIPKDNDSDDSDFIQSDDSHRKSGNNGSAESLSDLPDIGIDSYVKTPAKNINKTEGELETSRLSCSPFTSPLQDITKEVLDLTKDPPITQNAEENLKNRVTNNMRKIVKNDNFIKYDDDVTIIDSKPEIIDLNSDDDDDEQENRVKVSQSPKMKNENIQPKKLKDTTINQYMMPPSYPNQGVVYVKRKVRENELSKLNKLKEDLHNIRHLMNNMDMNTLPDRGVKIRERLNGLEEEVRRQGDKVANMVVEPDNPTPVDIANDGFDKGLTWDDIQKGSNAVLPRMYGKQAMATHMAERSVMLDRLRNLHESLASRPAESEEAEPPRGLITKLMPHQLHALAWLKWRETQRPTAGILADDMGLGKTITMIALIVSDKEGNKIDNEDDDDEDDDQPSKSTKMTRGGTLVVCPASLMQQWAGEVLKHCVSHCLSVCQHHGPSRASQPHRLSTYDLVLTTYNILQRDKEKNGVLMRVRWRRVILDEAHVVRNHKSATSTAVSALHAKRRWCLTGTPVQNKDLDLFALLKFLKCTPFDQLLVWKRWIDNKSMGGQERLSTIMRCILLRRTKLQLQQKGQLDCLPERTTHQQQVTFTKQEMNVYQKVLVFSKTLFAQFLHQRAEKNSDSVALVLPNKDSEYTRMHKKMIALQGAKPVKSHEILVLLLRLRQVCCHCGLIAAMLDEEESGDVYEDPGGKDLLAELNKLSLEDATSAGRSGTNDDEEQGIKEEGTTVAEAIRSVLSPNNPVFQLERPSSKIKAAMDCLKNNVLSKKGEKAVVVSQWTSVLRLVERELNELKVRCVTLSGSVPVPARPPLIDKLNDPTSDVKVMLLSLCAGGVGLNLCGANHLLLLDPHWNPQLEEQAQDRIYRVGQKKPVHIYRFMCIDTVEQTIKKLQESKLQLAENVLTGARNNNASKLTIEDLKTLFNMGQTQI